MKGLQLVANHTAKIQAVDPENTLSCAQRQGQIDQLCREFWDAARTIPQLKVDGDFARGTYELWLSKMLPGIALEYGFLAHVKLQVLGARFPEVNVTLIPNLFELGRPSFELITKDGVPWRRAVVDVKEQFAPESSGLQPGNVRASLAGGGAITIMGHVFCFNDVMDSNRRVECSNLDECHRLLGVVPADAREAVEAIAQLSTVDAQIDYAHRAAWLSAALSDETMWRSPERYRDLIVRGHEDYHVRGRPGSVERALTAALDTAVDLRSMLSVGQLIEERCAQIGEFCSGKFGAIGVASILEQAALERLVGAHETFPQHYLNAEWIVSHTVHEIVGNPGLYHFEVIDGPVSPTIQALLHIPTIARSPQMLAELEGRLYKLTEEELSNAARRRR
jgi:hypothetical protein